MLLEGPVLEVLYLTEAQTELQREQLPKLRASEYSAWLTFLLDRTYSWPDFADELFVSAHSTTKRVLACFSGESVLADFAVVRKSGKSLSEIHLTGIEYGLPEWPLNGLALSENNKKFLKEIISSVNGIVLANSSSKPHLVDGAAILLALRPDALLYRHCVSERTAAEINEQAESHLVIVAMKSEDPVDMVLQFNGLFSTSDAASARFTSLFRGAFIQHRVRRVCAGCARSTPVDSRTLDKVPELLRESVKTSYMFGRGCDLCGHSAYRGTIGLASALVADEGFREILGRTVRAADLALDAYNSGVRTVFEDGLEKIFTGLVSFEEVFSVTSNISASFAGAIAAHRSQRAATTERSSTATTKEGGVSSKKRVLIVEDDTDQRNVLESVFRTEGFEVYGAPNGQEALQSLELQPVDIVVCDVMMPVMNGAQFVKELRGMPKLKHLPVLMLTAVSNPDAECKLLAHGADDYCEKNVKRKVLLTRVEKLLQRNRKNPLQHML